MLLDGLNAVQGPALDSLRSRLLMTFRHLLLVSAAISLLGLCAAIVMPNQVLRGRGMPRRSNGTHPCVGASLSRDL